jgi:transposase-like protein
MGTRRHYSAEMKARASLEAIKGQRTANEIAGEFGIHPTVLASWKKQAIAGLPEIFSKGRLKEAEDTESLKATLYEEIGRLKVERDFLARKVPFRRPGEA